MASIEITQEELLRLAEQWEPGASLSPHRFRLASCVACGKPMEGPYWHLWLGLADFRKEIHLCRTCGLLDYGAVYDE